MKKISALLITSIFVLALTSSVSAYLHLEQTVSTSERWYGTYKAGYDYFPSDKITDHVYYDHFYKYPRIDRKHSYHRLPPVRPYVHSKTLTSQPKIYFM